MMRQPRRAAFFDRDGTIIRDVGYLSSINQIELIERSLSVCRFFQEKGYILILVTNQSGIARGFFSEQFVEEAHRYLFDVLEREGIYFTQAYYCPHHINGIIPDYTRECACRKPAPGMLFAAARDHDIDVKASVMIGDSPRDLQAGQLAGCSTYDINYLLALPYDDLERVCSGIFKQIVIQQGKEVD